MIFPHVTASTEVVMCICVSLTVDILLSGKTVHTEYGAVFSKIFFR